jgi:NAD+ synthase
MEFSKDVLKIDAAKVADELAGFICDKVRNYLKRKGAVIGLSGGIDSAVAGALCVKALGKERVHGLILPERDSNPVSREYGILSAKSLGITMDQLNRAWRDIERKREATEPLRNLPPTPTMQF